jgi:hypothetical protein
MTIDLAKTRLDLAFGFRVGEGENTLWREKVIFIFIKECIG